MDSFFGKPIIDKDEWRESPYPHRYVHGSFKGTDTRFAFCFPKPEEYEGRFVQFLQGGRGGNEYQGLLMGGLFVARANKAYYVESNQGHIGNDMSGLKGDISILNWRASAQSARYAKEMATETYGEPPYHGYVYGGSGGAMRSVNCLEAVSDIWDGAVPFMINRSALINYNWSLTAWVVTVLGDKVADVVHATDPGGAGDPFAVLDNDLQRQALATLYRAWYCRGAESQIEPNPLWILGMQIVWGADREYFTDFWARPGYEGIDNPEETTLLSIDTTGTVKSVKSAGDLAGEGFGMEDINAGVLGNMPPQAAVGVELETDIGLDRVLGANLEIKKGKAAGRRLLCTGAVKDALVAILDPVGFQDVEPGDTISITNRDFVAYLYYHRHLVSHTYPSMRQFFVDEIPIYAQRSFDLNNADLPSGKFEGKIILLQHAQDRECWPSCSEPYVEDVRRHLGEQFDQRFRYWWVENAAHLVPLTPAGQTRLINYQGCYAQAVRDMVAWVESGIAPPVHTSYHIDESGKLNLPSSAEDRGGIQPVISATANGHFRADVSVGETVNFEALVESPPGTGPIVSVEWDLDGSGSFAESDAEVDGTKNIFTAHTTFQYQEPGVYMVTVRAGIHRQGDKADRLHRITNLARVRVVVT